MNNKLFQTTEIKRFRIGRTQFLITVFDFGLFGFRYMFLRGWKVANIVQLDAFHSLEFSVGLISVTANITVKKPSVYDHEEDL